MFYILVAERRGRFSFCVAPVLNQISPKQSAATILST